MMQLDLSFSSNQLGDNYIKAKDDRLDPVQQCHRQERREI